MICEICGKKVKKRFWKGKKKFNHKHVNIMQETSLHVFDSHKCKLEWINKMRGD